MVGQVERGLEQTHKEIAYRREPAEAEVNDNKTCAICTAFCYRDLPPAPFQRSPPFAPRIARDVAPPIPEV